MGRPPAMGPAAEQLAEGLALLERSNDDPRIRATLGRPGVAALARDAISGEPVPHYVYRLECGHIIVVWTLPLPEGTADLYCEAHEGGRRCRVVEKLV